MMKHSGMKVKLWLEQISAIADETEGHGIEKKRNVAITKLLWGTKTTLSRLHFLFLLCKSELLYLIF